MAGSHKKQHYVPQFYLRQFRTPGSQSRIGVFAVERNLIVPESPIASQAQEAYLYDRSGQVEAALSKFEGHAGPVFNRLLTSGRLPARDDPDCALLFYILATFYGRTKRLSMVLESGLTGMAERLLETQTTAGQRTGRLDVRVEHGASLNAITASSLWFALGDLKLALLANRSGIEFVTSDHPVVLTNPFSRLKNCLQGSRGFIASGLAILLPLSPRLLLVAYDPAVYDGLRDVEELTDEETVRALNAHQLLWCEGRLFYSALSEPELRQMAAQWQPDRPPQLTMEAAVATGDGASPFTANHLCVPAREPALPFLRLTEEAERAELAGRLPDRDPRWTGALLAALDQLEQQALPPSRLHELVDSYYRLAGPEQASSG